MGLFKEKAARTRHDQYHEAASRDVEKAGELSSETQLERKLGWHEKFNVMRHNTGEAPIIVLAARLSAAKQGDSGNAPVTSPWDRVYEELLRRVQLLLNHKENGLLRASVQASTTKKPQFRLEGSIDAGQVVKRKVLSPANAARMEQVVQQELDDGGVGFHLEDKRPLWSVSLYSADGSDTEAFLALSTHHAIADGKGSQAILDVILFGGTESLVAGQRQPSTPQTIPPSSNATLPMNPPFFKLIIPLALQKYVMPHLAPVIPPPIRRTYNRKPAWPALRQKKNGRPSRNEPPVRWLGAKAPSAEQKRPGFRLVNFDTTEMVNGLKTNSKANGVKTIHPTLHAMMILALGVSLKMNSDTGNWVYASETPINHRTLALKHTEYTGNYIGAAWWRSEIHAESTSFWELARDYARTVSDENKRQKALITIGLLKYLKASPENKGVQAGVTYDMVDSEPATGWEKWWYDKSSGRRPHRVSAGLSNLGINDLSRPVLAGDDSTAPVVKAEQVAMLQCPSAIGPAIDVDVIGYKTESGNSGLNCFVSWRKGVMDQNYTDVFVDAFDVAGRLVAEGAFAGDVKMSQAVALVRERLGEGQ